MLIQAFLFEDISDSDVWTSRGSWFHHLSAKPNVDSGKTRTEDRLILRENIIDWAGVGEKEPNLHINTYLAYE